MGENDYIAAILETLRGVYGVRPWNWHTRQKPFVVLIATILSQRTRDSQTDAAAKALLRVYPTLEAIAHAPVEEIERLIHGVNYHKTKARRIKEVSLVIMRDFHGEIPRSFDALMKLPGVGRKTANCVLLYGFHEAALPVDTHVHRIANRLGWIRTTSPEETEEALRTIVPDRWLPFVNDLFVKHGQTVCMPKKPRCRMCVVQSSCAYGAKETSRVGC